MKITVFVSFFLLVFFVLHETQSFGFPWPRMSIQERPIAPRKVLNAVKGNGGENTGSEEMPQPENSIANGEAPKKVGRGRRTVDYPSFTYDLRPKYTPSPLKQKGKKEGEQYMKYYCAPLAASARRFKKPRAIEVPGQTIESMSWLDKLLVTLSGGFESGLGPVSVSALNTRLVKNRSYARKDAFSANNITAPPTIADLSYPPSKAIKGFWVGTPARVLTAIIAYFSFPYLVPFLDRFVTMPPEDLDDITSKFGPGVSVLYGTFISLTLSILYNRIKEIQDCAARESAMLTLVTRNLLSLFKDDREQAIRAAQCSADQIRTLVRSSRGTELMLVMYADPYARMLELVDNREQQLYKIKGDAGYQANLLGNCRDILKDLVKLRSERLSSEASSLPPTHFLILNLLTLLILLSYVVSILPTVDRITGAPPNESSILFAVLTNVYILFYFFAADINNPFDGVYQIRRSSSACNLLEAKWLIANHPLVEGEVDFEPLEEGPDGVAVDSPGIGELYFQNDDFFVDGDDDDFYYGKDSAKEPSPTK